MSYKCNANDVEIAYHPDGYRIDKTAFPIHRYTKWRILPDGRWCDMKPVCFHSLPVSGWIKVDAFTWDTTEKTY